MSTDTIAWLTDIHLNFLDAHAREQFYQCAMETGADKILITGDIAEAKDVCKLLSEFSKYANTANIFCIRVITITILVALLMFVKKFVPYVSKIVN